MQWEVGRDQMTQGKYAIHGQEMGSSYWVQYKSLDAIGIGAFEILFRDLIQVVGRKGQEQRQSDRLQVIAVMQPIFDGFLDEHLERWRKFS